VLEVRFTDSKWVQFQNNYSSNFYTVSDKQEACKDTPLSQKSDQPFFFPLDTGLALSTFNDYFKSRLIVGRNLRQAHLLVAFNTFLRCFQCLSRWCCLLHDAAQKMAYLYHAEITTSQMLSEP